MNAPENDVIEQVEEEATDLVEAEDEVVVEEEAVGEAADGGGDDLAEGDDEAAEMALAIDPEAEEDEAEAEIDEADLPLYVEAMLMATDKPMPTGKLAEALKGVKGKAVEEAIGELNALYEQTGRSFRVEKLAGGYQILTLPSFEAFVAKMNKTRSSNRLRAAAMETLSIIAYKQPVLRAELEAIRGVACGEVLRSLMERHLVKIVGRADEIGRPMLYGTTRQFLEVFGLSSLKDLPRADELRPKKQRKVIEEKAEEEGKAEAEVEGKAGEAEEGSNEAVVESSDAVKAEGDDNSVAVASEAGAGEEAGTHEQQAQVEE